MAFAREKKKKRRRRRRRNKLRHLFAWRRGGRKGKQARVRLSSNNLESYKLAPKNKTRH